MFIATQKTMRVLEGGRGSGNFGHSGRPGIVGGSSSERFKKVVEYIDARLNEKEVPAKAVRIPEERKLELIDKRFQGKQKPDVQVIKFTSGPTGAGKTAIRTVIGEEDPTTVLVDPDAYKMELLDVGTPTELHELSSELAKRTVDRAMEGGYSILYDTTGGNFDYIDSQIKKVIDNDGLAVVGHVSVSAETSIVRAALRHFVSGNPRKVPSSSSINSYNKSAPTFLALFNKYRGNKKVTFDCWDNDVDLEKRPRTKGNMSAVHIFSQIEGKLVVHNEKKFKEFTGMKYIETEAENGGLRYERIGEQRSTTEKAIARRAKIIERVARQMG